MPSCHFGNTLFVFYPSTRPLAIVHFARHTRRHRAGCWRVHESLVHNYLILLSFIL